MLTFPVDQWIGNAAAVLSGVWGAVTQRSTHSGYSRTAIYQHAERVVQAVANEQAGGISYAALWAENERLKAENEALWQAWSEGEERSECKQHALVSAGSAMGLSLTQSVIVLAIVVPSRMVPSRATVGRWGQPKRSAIAWHPGGPGAGVPGLSVGLVSRRNLLASRAHLDGSRADQLGLVGGPARSRSQRRELV
jgi:hypothetical protein